MSGALFDLLEAMVSELLANWIIFAKKVTFSFYSLYLWIVKVTVWDSKLSIYQINLNLLTLNLWEYVLTPKYSVCRTCNSRAHYSCKLSPQISTSCEQFNSIWRIPVRISPWLHSFNSSSIWICKTQINSSRIWNKAEI